MKLFPKSLIGRMVIFVSAVVCFDSDLAAQSLDLYILNRGKNTIISVPLNDPMASPEVKIQEKVVVSFDMITVPGSSRLYWIDGATDKIYFGEKSGGTGFDGSINCKAPVDIDYDPVGKRIYWADNLQKQIMAANADGSSAAPVLKDTFPDLAAIALYATKNMLFFADIDSGMIWSSTLTGENKKLLLHDSLGTPVRLLVDTVRQQLYWADDAQHLIGRMDLDGSKAEVFYQGGDLELPFALLMDYPGNRLLWTDYRLEAVMQASIFDGLATPLINSGLVDPMALLLVDPKTDSRDNHKDKVQLNVVPTVKVFPNPAQNKLTIASAETGQFLQRIMILDKSGKLVAEYYPTELQYWTMDISTLPEGLYVYVVTVEGKMLNGHFSVIH